MTWGKITRNSAAVASENQVMDTALARRRALRGRATDAERLLWRLLRSRQRGIRVVRFTNSELFENTDGVLEMLSVGCAGR